MIQHSNGWFSGAEFPRFAKALMDARGSLSFMTAGMWRAKYLNVRFDQRTGSFIVADGNSKILTPDEVYAMFPELKDE